jgi:hypothetical protein
MLVQFILRANRRREKIQERSGGGREAEEVERALAREGYAAAGRTAEVYTARPAHARDLSRDAAAIGAWAVHWRRPGAVHVGPADAAVAAVAAPSGQGTWAPASMMDGHGPGPVRLTLC